MGTKPERVSAALAPQGMLNAMTVLGLLLTCAPFAATALSFITGFRPTGIWDILLFLAAWGFLLGTPMVAGAAALIARNRKRKVVFRINLGFLVVWLLACIGLLFAHAVTVSSGLSTLPPSSTPVPHVSDTQPNPAP